MLNIWWRPVVRGIVDYVLYETAVDIADVAFINLSPAEFTIKGPFTGMDNLTNLISLFPQPPR